MMETTGVREHGTQPGAHGGHDEAIVKLVRMAGQIADFFKAYPDAEAVPGIADHINQFWTARMRDDFRTAFADRVEALPPLLRQVLPLIRPARAS